MKIYKNTMLRDTPLIMVEAWSECFTKTITKLLGFNWPDAIFIYNQSAVESWRSVQGFHTIMPIKMSEWSKNKMNLKKFLRQLDIYGRAYAEIQCRIKEKKHFSTKQALLEITKVYNLFLAGAGGLLPAYWVVTWDESFTKAGKAGMYPDALIRKILKFREKDAILDDSSTLVYRYLGQIAKNEGWPRHLVFFLSLKELKAVIKHGNQPDFVQLKQRATGYAYFNKKIFLGNEIRKNLKKSKYFLEQRKDKPAHLNVLTGTIANPGKARGRVVKIYNRDQMSLVKKGDILIASMTTPWYIPVMEKAAAFVTDEGGVICHAAIIAREMNKPCIVGTKFATKIFKTGDKVEVDANKGVVRKI